MSAPIFSIGASDSFADALCKGVIQRHGNDPLELSAITLLLPNRRSCITVRETFLRLSNQQAMLLPRMIPVGDVGLEQNMGLSAFDTVDIPPAISAIQSRMILTRLIDKWQKEIQQREALPISQAAHLAIQLAQLLEEIEKEQLSPEKFNEIVPDEFAQHWQITLQFLNIIMDWWPDELKEKGTISATHYQRLSLEALEASWQNSPPKHPVIAAGSTGSIPAVARLLKAITTLPHGTVILPGLDASLDEESWQTMDETHPQYGLKTLLHALDAPRESVKLWHQQSSSGDREALLREVMRPSQTTLHWQALRHQQPLDVSNIQRIDAEDYQQEAAIIALMLRHALETPQKTACLVTADRQLARHVTALMRRWHIDVDDSAGMALRHTPPAVFMTLLAETAIADAAPIPLLSCLKHPLASGSLTTASFRHHVRQLEKNALRGVRPERGLAPLKAASSSDLDHAFTALEPFLKCMQQKSVPFTTLLATHITCAEQLASNDVEQGEQRMWAGEDGNQLKQWLDELYSFADALGTFDPRDYLGIWHAMMEGQTWRPAYGQHPRLKILSPIEARLQHFDLMVLGGLNEGTWPAAPSSDPWMNRSMRDAFGLPSHDRKIGQSAHDFVQLCMAPEVVLTRSQKTDGKQTLPSRWLMRLDTVLELNQQPYSLSPQKPWCAWANNLHSVEHVTLPCKAPVPRPDAALRPKELYATRIETLMRDPYSIYASKILKLKALKPIDQDPGALEYGNFIHSIMEQFVESYTAISEQESFDQLTAIAQQQLAKEAVAPSVKRMWQPRFEKVAPWLAAQEYQRRLQSQTIHSERKGSMILHHAHGQFILSAKADRIERYHDGTLAIIDYKTGQKPSDKAVALGFSPQLPIEAWIAVNNGFSIEGTPRTMEYWQVGGSVVDAKRINEVKGDIDSLITSTKEGVVRLIEHFSNENTPYLHAPFIAFAPTYNDFEHLARVKEWRGLASLE